MNKKIAQAQFKLNALGYDAGEVDGINGKQTKLATKKFQGGNIWKLE